MPDRFNLERFVHAQQHVYSGVIAELTAAEKRSHWMWFIFPQIAGLGSSAMAQRYAISSMAEAAAYLAHPILGPRLVECTALVHATTGRTLDQIFGYPDDLKFHSSITLFLQVQGDDQPLFQRTLDKYFSGKQDSATLARLGQ